MLIVRGLIPIDQLIDETWNKSVVESPRHVYRSINDGGHNMIDDPIDRHAGGLRRGVQKTSNFDSAITQTIGFSRSRGRCPGSQHGCVDRLPVVLNESLRPGAKVGNEITGGRDGPVGVEFVGREFVHERVEIAPSSIQRGRLHTCPLGDHRQADGISATLDHELLDCSLDLGQHLRAASTGSPDGLTVTRCYRSGL